MRKPANQYKVWTEEDNENLLKWFNVGFSRAFICRRLGRPPNGVGARLRRLGIISERKEFSQYHW